MEEIGVVSSVVGPIAKVIVKKKGACDHCTAGTCHVKGDAAELDALNKVGAKVGQKVRVTMKPVAYVKGSLMLYGLPVLALVAGAILGETLFSKSFEGTDPELVSAVFAFGFFAISLVVVKLWSSRAEKSVQYKPIVDEIIED